MERKVELNGEKDRKTERKRQKERDRKKEKEKKRERLGEGGRKIYKQRFQNLGYIGYNHAELLMITL